MSSKLCQRCRNVADCGKAKLRNVDSCENHLLYNHSYDATITDNNGDMLGDITFIGYSNGIKSSFFYDGENHELVISLGGVSADARKEICNKILQICNIDIDNSDLCRAVRESIMAACAELTKKDWYSDVSYLPMLDIADPSQKATTIGDEDIFNDNGKFIPARMSRNLQRRHHIVTTADDSREMWGYDTSLGYYTPNAKIVIQQETQRELGDLSKRAYIDEVLTHVAIDTYRDRAIFNYDLNCINLQNGYYNIRTGEFNKHSPDMFFTYALPFKYDRNAACSYFDKLLDACNVDKTFIYEMFAYCLVSGYPIQAFFILIGDGGNGKGTVLRVLRHFLGEDNTTGHSMQALETNRYAMADLFGKRANICGDMPSTTVTETSPIKLTTGGDRISAPVIYKGNIHFENSAKMIFSLNHLPVFEDSTDSFDRRVVFHEFNTRVSGTDSTFDENRLWTDNELSGIFNRCIEVLPALLLRGKFTCTMDITATREYRNRRANTIGAFVDECTLEDTFFSEPLVDMYTAYKHWCTEHNETAKALNVFSRELLHQYPHIKRVRGTSSDLKRYNEIKGMKLTKEIKDLKLKLDEVEQKYNDSKGYSNSTGEKK